ncbi:tail fiber assembly protein [Achromobacter sp. NCFB-sbj8-Ac1-l]|uniref:tail fiber assembly protein n=1 Tax=unclassified Achromobacter TaxID=2626865 RepID=UPI004046DD5E
MFAKWVDEDQRFSYALEDNGGVEISTDFHAQIIADGAAGKWIQPDKDGKPVASDPPAPTTEQLAASARSQRDSNLQVAAFKIAPLQDATDLGLATKEEDDQLKAWKLYRVALMRIEQQAGFPANIQWPAPPST